MSATDFGSLSAARKRVWAAKTWKEGRDETFFYGKGFMSKKAEDHNKPITYITELTKTSRGLECVMQLVADLQGDGVAGDNTLEGNEEALVNDEQTITIDQLRHGVRSKGEMAEQATVIRFRKTAREKLKFWLSDKIDELLFLTLSGRSFTYNTNGSTRGSSQLPQLAFAADVKAATSNRVIYGGSATSEGSLTASDKITWDMITSACAFAKRQKIKPIREGGKDYMILVLSTEQLRDLKQDTDFKTIMANAGVRGTKNPLFTSANYVIDDIVIHEHNKVYNTLGAANTQKWGSGGLVDGAQALLLGAQAAGFAAIDNSFMRESDNTDYGNKPGIGFGRKIGTLKPQFMSRATEMSREDFGVVAVKTAAKK